MNYYPRRRRSVQPRFRRSTDRLLQLEAMEQRRLLALLIDFGATDDAPLQAGYEGFSLVANAPAATMRTYTSTLASDGDVDITVAGATHARDYAAITSGPFVGLSDLLSDSALRNANGTMSITLADLNDGTYEITTYHHGTQFGGGNFILEFNDGNNTDVNNPTGVANVTSTSGTAPGSITTQSFQFEVVGGSDVILYMTGGTGGNHAQLNGFDLQPVLNVDFGQDANGDDPLQTNFAGFNRTGNGSAAKTQTFNSGLGSAGTVDVTITNPTHYRDYAAITSGAFVGQSNLLSDHVLRNADGTMTLTLTDLSPGSYEILSYHHNTQNLGGGIFDVTVTDARGTNQSVHTGVVTSNSSGGASPSSITTLTTTFQSDSSINGGNVDLNGSHADTGRPGR